MADSPPSTPRFPASDRIPLFPAPPDRLYNYAAELGIFHDDAYYEKTIGDFGAAPDDVRTTRIAVIGAGLAGTTVVRELVKLGFKNITLIEGSPRIGGRLYSIEPTNTQTNRSTVNEMGAMRMPLFDEHLPASARTVRNSLLDHYVQLYDVAHAPFPNPGLPWEITKGTGIYVNDGYGTDPGEATATALLQWAYRADQIGTEASLPVPGQPDHILNVLLRKWNRFANTIVGSATAAWNDLLNDGLDADPERFNAAWRARYWDTLSRKYQGMSFYQVAVLPTSDGGVGMTDAEASLFYVVGAGNGSWGAFFNVAASYVMTTLLFGYGNDHRVIAGPRRMPGGFAMRDSYDNALAFLYKGVQSFPEMHLAMEARYAADASTGAIPSFMQGLNHDLSPTDTIGPGFNLLTRCMVTGYRQDENVDPRGPIRIRWRYDDRIDNEACFDHVFITSSPWSTTLNSEIEGRLIGFQMKRAMSVSHSIMSTKVMLPFKVNPFGGDPAPPPVHVPQMLATDTCLLQAYAYAQPGDAGILAVSYTWENDSRKLLSVPDGTLADTMLREFGRCLIAGREQTGIADETAFQAWCSAHIDGYDPKSGPSRYEVIHWSKEALYRGCAKLSAPGTLADNNLMYAYNERTADGENPANIYFAGDMYSFESGWAEGALRTAMDAVIWFVTRNVSPDFAQRLQYPRMPYSVAPWKAPEKSPDPEPIESESIARENPDLAEPPTQPGITKNTRMPRLLRRAHSRSSRNSAWMEAPLPLVGQGNRDAMTTQYATVHVDAARRFDYWNDVVCKHCIPATSRMLTNGPFDAALRVQSIGVVDVNVMAAPWHQWTRGPHHLRVARDDDLWIGYMQAGHGVVQQQGREAKLHDGAMVLYDAARHFDFTLASQPIFLVRFPRCALLRRCPQAEQMVARVLDEARPGVAALRSMLQEAATIDFSEIRPDAATQFGSTLLDLTGVVLDFHLDHREPATERGLYARLVNHIQRHFDDPELSLATLAASQHVSPRTVVRAFARHDQTAMGMVARIRLEASQRALAEGRAHSVKDAALSHGFSDVSHFSRAFRRAFGYAPHTLIPND